MSCGSHDCMLTAAHPTPNIRHEGDVQNSTRLPRPCGTPARPPPRRQTSGTQKRQDRLAPDGKQDPADRDQAQEQREREA
eukprot:11066075-Alexandrium_andersonii.AAC.1